MPAGRAETGLTRPVTPVMVVTGGRVLPGTPAPANYVSFDAEVHVKGGKRLTKGGNGVEDGLGESSKGSEGIRSVENSADDGDVTQGAKASGAGDIGERRDQVEGTGLDLALLDSDRVGDGSSAEESEGDDGGLHFDGW